MATTKKERLLTRKVELEVAKLEAELAHVAGSHESARHFVLNNVVEAHSVNHCMREIGRAFRNDPEEPIEVVFNTPGGDVFAGLALFDYIRSVVDAGCPVTTMSYGYAASMGAVLLQAGSYRAMSANSWLMIHEPSTMAWGKASELRDEVDMMKRLDDQLLHLLAERSTLTIAQVRRKASRRDWWMTAEEALELGFIDEVC